MIVLLTPPQVFLRLSWVSERPASCCFTFVNKKSSTGEKSGKLSGSVISGMALRANQFSTAAAIMTSELFQPLISVKNGPDSKIRLARAEARSLVIKCPIFSTAAETAPETVGAKVGMFEVVVFADQRLFSQP